ncbi:uncharacterized protein H6S33_008385 [Morchella sextelata]|uniref:uncharacterized protein n=1 Tax=Morchella sextelata TaxID=1174677 RepID=UPI001D04323F|nr:uncharacterized protein H6S33_008385 [Morchella sextelata]KAH0602735.1 hypothetical protein H6S33_008385 [Morchella sextelata]
MHDRTGASGYRAGTKLAPRGSCTDWLTLPRATNTSQYPLSFGGRSYRGHAILPFGAFVKKPKYPAREVDSKNAERLKKVFKTFALERTSPLRRIPVLLSEAAFQEILHRSNVREERLTHILQGDLTHISEIPRLDAPDGSVEYLHGHHRILAAKAGLAEEEHWWGVDVYIEEYTTADEIYFMQNQYVNSANITDEEIFRAAWALGNGCWAMGVGQWVLGNGCWAMGISQWAHGGASQTTTIILVAPLRLPIALRHGLRFLVELITRSGQQDSGRTHDFLTCHAWHAASCERLSLEEDQSFIMGVAYYTIRLREKL